MIELETSLVALFTLLLASEILLDCLDISFVLNVSLLLFPMNENRFAILSLNDESIDPSFPTKFLNAGITLLVIIFANLEKAFPIVDITLLTALNTFSLD